MKPCLLRSSALKLSRLLVGVGVLLVAGCGKNPAKPIPLPPLSKVVLAPVTDTLQVGQSKAFTATAYDTTGAIVASATFQWASTDPLIFTVAGAGNAKGVGEGVAMLIIEAGGKKDTATVAVFRQTGWYAQTSNTSANLNGVFFQPDGRSGWAVGDRGTIVATLNAGDTWGTQVSNTTFNLHAVWFTDADSGWAVGDNGIVRRTTNRGVTWKTINPGASENLSDVFFATPDTGWVVGTSGVIMRTFDHGLTWQKLYPTASTLRSVSFAGTLDGWAVGDGGVIVGTHDRGLTWFVVQPSLTAQNIKSVWRRSESQTFAVGAVGVTPRTTRTMPDSTTWQLMNAGSLNQLEGVQYPEDMIGYAVGFNSVGIVLRTDDGGVSWQNQTSNSQFRLNDVYFVDALRGWAVGNSGAIIHTARGGQP